MRLPDFIIGGAPRSATTALYQSLARCPDVFLSDPKEPHFFSRTLNHTTDEAAAFREYASLFEAARPEQRIAEASTSYLLSAETAAARIHRVIPGVQMVFILREPVARAYSYYMLHRMYGWEDAPTFAEALADEPRREAAGVDPLFSYFEAGRYLSQVQAMLKVFPREQLWFAEHGAIANDWDGQTAGLQEFLDLPTWDRARIGVNASFEPRSFRLSQAMHGRGGLRRIAHAVVPLRSVRIRIGNALRWANFRTSPGIDAQTAADLAGRYDNDMDLDELERLTGLDLSSWRQQWDTWLGVMQPRP